MAIDKTINIKVLSDKAQKNISNINEVIDEQRAILVLLEEEYLKAKKALDDYNSSNRTNLAQERVLKKTLKERKDALQDQRLGLKKLALEQRESNKAAKVFRDGQKENTNIIRGIDKLTGGYATKLVKLKKGFVSGVGAVKGFITGLSGVQKALIATGFGAAIAAIGLLISNLDKFKTKTDETAERNKKLAEALGGKQGTIVKLQTYADVVKTADPQTKEFKNALAKLKKEGFDPARQSLDDFIQSQIKYIQLRAKQGVVEAELTEKFTELQEFEAEKREKNLRIRQLEDKAEKETNLVRRKRIQSNIEFQKKALKNLEDDFQPVIEEVKKLNEELSGLTGEVLTAENKTEGRRVRTPFDTTDKRQAFLDKLEEDVNLMQIDLDGSDLALDLDGVINGEGASDAEVAAESLRLKYDALNQTELEQLNVEEQRELSKLDGLVGFEETRTQIEEVFAQKREEITKKENDAKQQALEGYAQAISGISSVIGQDTQEGKMLAIAASLINTYAAIAGQLKAFSGVPIPGYAIAQAIATGVVGFANVKKIASVKIPKTQGSAGAVSGSVTSGGGSAPAPPSFNIVGVSDTNQLADAIGGQTQQPIQAFVEANDVTTAQSLENNIVEGATL